MTKLGKYRVVARDSLLVSGLLTVVLMMSACSNAPTCDEPELYQSAVSGTRISSPDGLSDISAFREMTIPDASPRPPRDPSAGCLERPPTLRLVDDEPEAEPEVEGT